MPTWVKFGNIFTTGIAEHTCTAFAAISLHIIGYAREETLARYWNGVDYPVRGRTYYSLIYSTRLITMLDCALSSPLES